MASPHPANLDTASVAIAIILSGKRRGQVQELRAETLRVAVDADAEVRVEEPGTGAAQRFAATLHRRGNSYELVAAPDSRLWVNGQRVTDSRVLDAGDLIELAPGGPLLRYRLTSTVTPLLEEPARLLADSPGTWPRARFGAPRWLARWSPRGANGYTWRSVRLWLLVLLTLLVLAVITLVASNLVLQQQIGQEAVRIDGLARAIDRTGAAALSREELLQLQAAISARLAATLERVQALEARRDAYARVIAAASPSVALIVGSYGFVEPESGQPLRYLEGPAGMLLFSLDPEWEVVELTFTGTGFVVDGDGVMLTNQHVAQPWTEDQRAELAAEHGFHPRMRQMKAYFPGLAAGLDLELVKIAERADLAVVRALTDARSIAPLRLRTEAPPAGEEVVVLGYPLGLAGLLMRAEQALLEQSSPNGQADFWALADLLAASGQIAPLASRGIIGQVSEEVIVYDAETAIGGSGGPVLDLYGQVLAINMAIVEEFAGSNLGVPASKAAALLQE